MFHNYKKKISHVYSLHVLVYDLKFILEVKVENY